MTQPNLGRIVWTDLTVPNAEAIRDFYAEVVGWKPEPVDMGDYADFNMTAPGSGDPAAGVCHARGANVELPPVWLVYITVANLDRSLEACRAKGGDVLIGPKGMGGEARYAVIRDPAGAVCALYQMAS